MFTQRLNLTITIRVILKLSYVNLYNNARIKMIQRSNSALSIIVNRIRYIETKLNIANTD